MNYLETYLTIAHTIYETAILHCSFINPMASLTTDRHLTICVVLITSADVTNYQINVKRVK